MPDPFKPVQPGERVTFSAAVWNAMLRAGQVQQARRHDMLSGPRTTNRDACIVRIRNDTGTTLNRGSVVGLDGPIFLPSDSEDAFLREVTFRGVVPTEHTGHRLNFAIMLEPCPNKDRAIARAYVSGVCPVMIDVIDVTHQGADAIPGDTTMLQSSGGGSVEILWREGFESGGEEEVGYVGVQWAIVRFGSRGGGRIVKTTTTVPGGSDTGPGGPGTGMLRHLSPTGAYGALAYSDVHPVDLYNAMPDDIAAGQLVLVNDVEGYWVIYAVPCLLDGYY
jgi:hypothetical protein